MLKRLAQVLPLVTILAMTSNAECAISCALTSMMMPASSGAPAQIAGHQEDHACCPRHRQSHTGTSPAKSCPQVNSQFDNARIESNRISIPALTPLTGFEAQPVQFPLQSLNSTTSWRTGDPPGPDIPFITVLRI
jgi:hypothetical protein